MINVESKFCFSLGLSAFQHKISYNQSIMVLIILIGSCFDSSENKYGIDSYYSTLWVKDI